MRSGQRKDAPDVGPGRLESPAPCRATPLPGAAKRRCETFAATGAAVLTGVAFLSLAAALAALLLL